MMARGIGMGVAAPSPPLGVAEGAQGTCAVITRGKWGHAPPLVQQTRQYSTNMTPPCNYLMLFSPVL